MKHILLSGFADEISSNFDKQLEVLKRLNMSYMEIRGVNGCGIDTYTVNEAKEIKKRLDEENIKISALASPIGKIGIEEEFQNHFEHFKHVVELAHILEAPYIRIFSFFMPKDKDASDYKTKVLDQLSNIVYYQGLDNIQLLHENEKEIYGDTPERCLEIMTNFSSTGKLKMTFDFANFIQCNQSTEKAFDMLKEYIAYVHIKDAVEQTGAIVPAGNGDGKIKNILKKLQAQNYSGFLSLEPHLTEFEGLKNLEREAASLKGMNKLDGEIAFTTAFKALLEILNDV